VWVSVHGGSISPDRQRLQRVISSEDLPAQDRFEWWCEIAAQDTVPAWISSPHAGDFRATAAMLDRGPVQMSILSFPALRSVGTPLPVRRCDPERYGLTLITTGAVWFTQRHHQTRVNAGEFLLYDTSLPFDSRALPDTTPARMLILHIPPTALPAPAQRLRPLPAHSITATHGLPAILAQYLSSIVTVRDNDPLAPADRHRLGAVALDLASATLAAQADAEDPLPPETRQEVLRSRIEAFIQHNLHDPDLTPATIAAHHHISVGYLHRIFQSRDRTVAAEIRHQRLQRCQTDLADPRLRTHPIHLIATRWGFRHAADFSRAFRTTHGLSPRDHRQQALGVE
jgi:AraC-like DNA-binding protein